MIRRPPRSTPFPTRRSSDLRPTWVAPLAPQRMWERGFGAEAALPRAQARARYSERFLAGEVFRRTAQDQDRKSTRLNSSHPSISYAVFCLKKKKQSILTLIN